MDLKEFLEKVVGTGSIYLNEDGWEIKPFEINAGGRYISFKGQRFQNYGNTDPYIVESIVQGMNYAYGMAIKDVVGSGNVSQSIKPFKFI
jgi:hypothetical protein